MCIQRFHSPSHLHCYQEPRADWWPGKRRVDSLIMNFSDYYSLAQRLWYPAEKKRWTIILLKHLQKQIQVNTASRTHCRRKENSSYCIETPSSWYNDLGGAWQFSCDHCLPFADGATTKRAAAAAQIDLILWKLYNGKATPWRNGRCAQSNDPGYSGRGKVWLVVVKLETAGTKMRCCRIYFLW